LVTDSHSILARWRNHFSQLFSVHVVSNIGQAEIHTTEPRVPESLSDFEVVRVIENKKSQITRY